MSGLRRRLKYYGIGFALGLIVVWATLLRNRDRASWLPEGRTLEFLERVDMAITERAQCQLDCLELTPDIFDKQFWEKADLDFKKSATQRKPCPEYYITSTLSDNRKVIIFVETCEYCEDCEQEGTAFLRSIEVEGKECDC